MSDANKAPIVAVSHMWLGNYRAWGALTIYHAIVFAGILTVAALWFVIVLTRRIISTRNHRNSIPNRSRPLPMEKSDMSKKMWNVLGEQEDLRRDCELHLQPRDSFSADRGWYKHPSAGEGGVIDIGEEIQKSHLKIDEAVRTVRGALRHSKFRTVRDYVNVLQNEFPALTRLPPHSDCQDYVELYERARYGSVAMTMRDLNHANRLVQAMVEAIVVT